MRGFSGFGKVSTMTKIPGEFFSEILPDIQSLAEMKVTLYAFWWMQKRENASYLQEKDFLADPILMQGLGARPDAQHKALQKGLELAVARGTLIKVVARKADSEVAYYYIINTARGRAVAEAIEAGQWVPERDDQSALDLRVERPNVFTLYEQNIGPLTPMVADNLRDLSADHGEALLAEAIRIAVQNNVRKMAYIESVIKRRLTEGKPTENPPSDDNWLAGSKYADEIEI